MFGVAQCGSGERGEHLKRPGCNTESWTCDPDPDPMSRRTVEIMGSMAAH
jgi:hypothetical protein